MLKIGDDVAVAIKFTLIKDVLLKNVHTDRGNVFYNMNFRKFLQKY